MTAPDEVALVDRVIARARKAQLAFEASGSQERYDQAAQAVGWAIMEPARNRSLAELAVQTTGLGNVADKITKNHRKTLGLLRDNNIINAVKSGNAIVLSPSPKGIASCELLLDYIYAEFDKIGIDRDLVQMLPAPGSKAKTQRILPRPPRRSPPQKPLTMPPLARQKTRLWWWMKFMTPLCKPWHKRAALS